MVTFLARTVQATSRGEGKNEEENTPASRSSSFALLVRCMELFYPMSVTGRDDPSFSIQSFAK